MTTQNFKGYNLVQAKGSVDVFDPRRPACPVHRASDFDAARRWVKAYRDGAAWAVLAVLS